MGVARKVKGCGKKLKGVQWLERDRCVERISSVWNNTSSLL